MKLKILLLKGKTLYIIHCVLILLISYLLNMFVQMLLFILLFNLIQNCFIKRFHADTIYDKPIKANNMCKIMTIAVEIIYLIFCKKLNITLYSNLFIIFIICFMSCLLQFYFEKKIICNHNLSNLEYLKSICQEAKLSELSTKRLIMRYVEKKTIKEIAIIECVDEGSIKKSISRSKRKLNIKY